MRIENFSDADLALLMMERPRDIYGDIAAFWIVRCRCQLKRKDRLMKRYLGYVLLSLLLSLGIQPVFAQTSPEYQDLKKEIESLKQGQAALKQDLLEIKKLIQSLKQAPAAPGGEFKEAIINIKGAPITGDKNAKLVLIEFTDYQ
jgi:hypothetical protein